MRRARPLDVQVDRSAGVGQAGPPPKNSSAGLVPQLQAPAASASSAPETVVDPTAALSRTNGVIFIEIPFGLARCSGTAVNAPNFSVVFTAAHCVHSGGRDGFWFDHRWAFVPGYRHGYPAAPPFDGETQQECTNTRFLGHDAISFLSPGPLNLAVDCGVTGGSSGVGWTIRDGVLNSVTNYGYSDDPATDFGAYFGREVAKMYGRAASVR
jgi:hypothetical protein